MITKFKQNRKMAAFFLLGSILLIALGGFIFIKRSDDLSNLFTSEVLSVGSTYYVDKDSIGGKCSDSGLGTMTAPFCSMTKAISLVSAGDQILMRAGTYSGFEIQKSGTSSSPITIANYPNETVIINGNNAPQSVSLRNASYVKIEGLKVTGAAGNYDGGIRVSGGQGNIIQSNEVYNNKGTNTQGIVVYDSLNNTITKNIVHDNYLSGISVSDASASGKVITGNVISENTVYNNTNAVAPGNADGIKLSGVNHTGALIKNNTVYSNGDDGIDTWNTHGNTVEGNIVYNQNLAGDGNGIKAGGSTTGGSNIIQFNIVYSNKSNGITSNGSGGNRYYNNVAYNNGKYGFDDGWKQSKCATESCKTVFINNIGFNNTTANMIANVDTGESHNNLWFDSNSNGPKISYNYSVKNSLQDFFSASGNRLEDPSSSDRMSVVSDPQFVNLTGFDFHLQASSPAIDKGDKNNPAGISVKNSAPDLGAYEYDTLTVENPTTEQPTQNPETPITSEPVTSDSIAPSVTITYPSNGLVIDRRKSITITAEASDDVSVAKVEFYVKGQLICTDTTSSYSCGWKPNKAGSYTIEVKAYDSSNNFATSSVTVTAQ